MARGARFRMTGATALKARLFAYPDNLTQLGAQAVLDAAEFGADQMRERIETSGTGWEGREGRIDSGAMLRDVTASTRAGSGMTRAGHRSRSASFGWVNNQEDYYRLQEEGFTNIYKDAKNEGKTWGGTPYSGTGGPPGWTQGMNAYTDAFVAARERFRENINGITRRAWYHR